jgi:hypothetical protein
MILKMAVVSVVAPCNLIEVYRRFRGACCLHHQGDDHLKLEGATISETSVNFYETTQRYNPEDSQLYTHRCENLKSHEHDIMP